MNNREVYISIPILAEMERTFGKMTILEMPALVAVPATRSTEDVGVSNEYHKFYVDYCEFEDAIAQQLGLETRNHGIVPVFETELDGCLGTTFYDNDEALAIAMDRRLRKYSPLLRKRVFWHEVGHVQSEKMVKYCDDLQREDAVMILESIPEYGMRKAFEHKSRKRNDEFDKMARLIKATSPYGKSVAFGELADEHYASQCTGKKGYSALIHDIKHYRSGRYVMELMNKQIKRKTGMAVYKAIEHRANYKKA